MAKFSTERVLDVHHWNDTLFSFKTSRDPGLRFRNGEFIMLGLTIDDRPIMRAYSIASANHEDHLEFLSIKVETGKLTSALQHLKPGDDVLIGSKPTGSLLIDDLKPGKNLYLFGTGTGLAPFLGIVQDPEVYERFERVILFHGVRFVSELAYHDLIKNKLPRHEYLGDMISNSLIYCNSVTREAHPRTGRLTQMIETGNLASEIGLPPLNPETDRAMICGGPGMLKDLRTLLDARGFQISERTGSQGDYVVERAFVER